VKEAPPKTYEELLENIKNTTPRLYEILKMDDATLASEVAAGMDVKAFRHCEPAYLQLLKDLNAAGQYMYVSQPKNSHALNLNLCFHRFSFFLPNVHSQKSTRDLRANRFIESPLRVIAIAIPRGDQARASSLAHQVSITRRGMK
jgi:hypothetical protein